LTAPGNSGYWVPNKTLRELARRRGRGGKSEGWREKGENNLDVKWGELV